MNKNALVIVGGWSSPDIEWKLSPLVRMSGSVQGPDIFIYRKCSNGFGDIEHIGKDLVMYIKERKYEGYDNVFLMGHSMGGLVCRMAEIWSQEGDVAGIVTVATPHQGAALASLGRFSLSARQMMPGSEFLRNLHDNPARCPVYSIVCKYDEIVWPKSSATYQHSSRVDVLKTTHVGAIFSRKLAWNVLSFICDEQAGARGSDHPRSTYS